MVSRVACCIIVVSVFLSTPAAAQDEAPNDEMISLNLPDEIELKLLVALVSDQLDIKVLYDEQVGNKRVTVKAPVKVPKRSLLGLLESALRMKGLALVKDDQPGWYRIIEARQLAKFAGAVVDAPDGALRGTAAITQVFSLTYSEPQRVEAVIKPFLTEPGGNTILVPEQRLLIVTDYAATLGRIAELIERVDQPRPDVHVRFVGIRNLSADKVAAELKRILAAKRKASGATGDIGGPDILELARTNELVLIGPAAELDEAVLVLEQLDVPLGLETRVYRFATASPQQVDNLTRNLLPEADRDRLYQSVVDASAGLLVVTTTPDIHAKVEAMREGTDAQAASIQPVVRFYKLANTTVGEVLATINQIQRAGATAPAERKPEGDRYRIPPPGPNQPPSDPGAVLSDLPTPPAVVVQEDKQDVAPTATAASILESGNARIVADENTNTLIVVADPSAQEVYSQLIKQLDRRRPQVLLEVVIVTLDTSGSFSFGVEIAGTGGGDPRVLTFSSFGLSEVDEDTGRLTLTPGLGFNGAVLSADIVDVVIRALETSGRAKVYSAPKILVNDNAPGRLSSTLDAPFSSVNASDTVATTSFGGFESAGTTIDITPHIAEGDHLTLEYTVTLSAFTGESDTNIPPPRQTNEVSSTVTVPDGHAILVGGLKRADFNETVTKVPFLGDIPIVEYLFSNRTLNNTDSTLFIFIRPVILRDDHFQDLKFLSDRDLDRAELPRNYPSSQPIIMR